MARRNADEAFEEAAEVIKAEIATIDDAIDTGINEMIRSADMFSDANPVEAYRQIIQNIMESGDVEAILNPPEPGNITEYANETFRFLDFKFIESDYEQGAAWYSLALCEHVDTGTKTMITTGQQGVMAQLLRLKQLGAFPFVATIVPSRKTNRFGKHMYRLVGKKG